MHLEEKWFNELTPKELYEILKSRAEIFIKEQQINYQDMDDIDYKALHCYFIQENRVVAYLRAFYIDEANKIVKVGRVLTLHHGKGLGRKILEESINAIRDKMKAKTISMNAQKHAIGFYEKLGFTVTSEEFLEEGVIHVKMELNL